MRKRTHVGSSLRNILISGLFAFSFSAPVHADKHPLPDVGPDVHLGVASCAGSTCHGATRPFKDSPVLQNEYITWAKKDAHAEAYKVLLNDESKRIAKNLGLKKEAHREKVCLDCHADNVQNPQLKGRRFQLSDGVGCEACHGGSDRWLGPHVSGRNSHQENVDLGLYPTEDPVARAKLCLSCHFGNDRKFVTHEIMGAGHPRLAFELDTFTAIQPAHYRIDKDYRERKKVSSGVQTWAIGQTIAVDEFLKALADPKRHTSGLFPELVLFDCQACHHSLEDTRWQPRKLTGLEPGVVRLADANMVMLNELIGQLDPAMGQKFTASLLALHQASTKGMNQTAKVAEDMRSLVKQAQGKIAKHRFSNDDVWQLFRGMIDEGLSGELFDYAAAEQGVMAMSALVSTLESSGAVNKERAKQINDQVNKLFDLLEEYDGYNREAFQTALKQLQQVIGS